MENGAIRSLKVSKCCCAKIVVGTRTATCLLFITALNAHRIATSVLPNPTSPQSNLSIGVFLYISCMISSITYIWSGVSL